MQRNDKEPQDSKLICSLFQPQPQQNNDSSRNSFNHRLHKSAHFDFTNSVNSLNETKEEKTPKQPKHKETKCNITLQASRGIQGYCFANSLRNSPESQVDSISNAE